MCASTDHGRRAHGFEVFQTSMLTPSGMCFICTAVNLMVRHKGIENVSAAGSVQVNTRC